MFFVCTRVLCGCMKHVCMWVCRYGCVCVCVCVHVDTWVWMCVYMVLCVFCCCFVSCVCVRVTLNVMTQPVLSAVYRRERASLGPAHQHGHAESPGAEKESTVSFRPSVSAFPPPCDPHVPITTLSGCNWSQTESPVPCTACDQQNME